jgi:6-carboxyhexanoate--CoA ligase
MRAAMGKIHEEGGQHLSGCERLVKADRVPYVLQEMWQRMTSHPRGNAGAANIRIDLVEDNAIYHISPLAIESVTCESITEAHGEAGKFLQKNGISEIATRKAFARISGLKQSMRGAMVLDATTGERLDSLGERGVRVSHMDCEDEEKFTHFLRSQIAKNDPTQQSSMAFSKPREAVILASKAAAATGYVGELCWSDDPFYVTGYVASKQIYRRISPMKTMQSSIGGRVFFLESAMATRINEVVDYWQKQPVLLTL